MKKPNIYFISNSITPLKDIGGGSVVIYRHLKKLEADGYHIIFINCNSNHNKTTEFEQVNIPKKKWYPPLRKFTPWLTSMRFEINYQFLKTLLSFTPQDKIISILEDPGSLLAYTISKRTKTPYYLFFHDDNVFGAYSKNNILTSSHLKKIIALCKHIFVVSKPMRDLITSNNGRAVTVLYPIPSGDAYKKDIKKVNFNQLSFCYSGMTLPFHDYLIEKIYLATQKTNSTLTLISNFDDAHRKRYSSCPTIRLVDKIPELHKLFKFFMDHIDVLIIFYSFNLTEEIRAEHSFPSKFVEFCHLGIPILIIAPEQSAIGKWAIENNWKGYLASDRSEDLEIMLKRYKEQDFWLMCQEQSSYFAKKDFNPVFIHQQLLTVIK